MPSFPEELARRMAGPQRHRLLQGYPMLPLLQRPLEAMLDLPARHRRISMGVLVDFMG
jgi:hypothetical protein